LTLDHTFEEVAVPIRPSTFIVIVVALSVVNAGCGGTAEDICTAAAEHLEACMGVTNQATGACNPDRASLLLSIPCESLAAARGTFSSGGTSDLVGWMYDDGGFGDGEGDTAFWGGESDTQIAYDPFMSFANWVLKGAPENEKQAFCDGLKWGAAVQAASHVLALCLFL
jgi:hypothetical protein